MNIFSIRDRSVSGANRPLSDRLFGKDVSNVLNKNHPDPKRLTNRSFVDKILQNPHKKQQTSVVLNNSSLIIPNISLHSTTISQPVMEIQNQSILPQQDKFAYPYSGDILNYLLCKEDERVQNLFAKQSQINESMRAILIDWLADVHHKLKLMPETFYMVIQLIDRYIRNQEVKKNKFQLLGLSCLYIAAKFQQTYKVPSIKELIYLCANSYDRHDILEMQASVLKHIDFNIHRASVYYFMTIFTKACGLENKDISLVQYVCQLSLLQSKFNKFKSSTLAASAVYLINKIKSKLKQCSSTLMSIVKLSQSELRLCAKELCSLLQNVQSKAYTKSLRKKFGCQQFHEVSRLKIQRKTQ